MPDKITIFSEQTLANPAEAFARLFFDHYRIVFMEALYLLKDEQEAKDIVQEVFIELWNRQQFTEIAAIKAYLTKAVRNRCLNALKSRKLRSKREEDYQYVNSGESAGQHNTDIPEAERVRDEQVSGLRTALQDLPPKTARIFEMYYLEKKSRHEVALEAGVSINTVKTALSRGLTFLRNKLK